MYDSQLGCFQFIDSLIRERDRERAQARNGGKGKGKDDGLTPEQRRERDAKALQEKAAKKAAGAAGNAGATPNTTNVIKVKQRFWGSCGHCPEKNIHPTFANLRRQTGKHTRDDLSVSDWLINDRALEDGKHECVE
ncbi:hypothetical protein TEA_024242 [Camellia sinensis var. sinensis]|uniref:Small EDRK-rich factor-like N-terminal domain-containing protein n=1 Tax=Camellia sinensis var. sinensis TaxID=542762 RepID=A0A4S4D3M3_CAMSN|nr:hypothetical protein TEA_024242 [Camellia sinensis var. sinensis]